MAPSRTGVARLNGWRIAYEARGDSADAVVFVHGGAHDRAAWRYQLAGLRLERRLVALDLIGHGESDKPDVTYSMDLSARSVAAVLDHLGLQRAVLVGHSNGVPTIRQFYRLFPERVEAFVAVDGMFRQTMPRKTVDWMVAALTRPDYQQFIDGLVERTPAGAVPPEDLEHIKHCVRTTPRHVMASTLEVLTDPAIWEEDPIGVPLLVLRVKTSQPSGEEEALVRRLAPQVEYHEWEGVSHFVMLERPDAFNALVERFVAGLEVGGRG